MLANCYSSITLNDNQVKSTLFLTLLLQILPNFLADQCCTFSYSQYDMRAIAEV